MFVQTLLFDFKDLSGGIGNHLDTADNSPNPRNNQITEEHLENTSTDHTAIATTFVDQTTNKATQTYT